MQQQIGEVAGKVWKTLGKKGELSITMIPKFVKAKSDLIYQSLGWLAREGKIVYTKRDNKNFISLTGPEMESFRHSGATRH